MWWVKLRVSRDDLQEVVITIKKRFQLPSIYRIEKYSGADYIVSFTTTSTLDEILRILGEEGLFNNLVSIGGTE